MSCRPTRGSVCSRATLSIPIRLPRAETAPDFRKQMGGLPPHCQTCSQQNHPDLCKRRYFCRPNDRIIQNVTTNYLDQNRDGCVSEKPDDQLRHKQTKTGGYPAGSN